MAIQYVTPLSNSALFRYNALAVYCFYLFFVCKAVALNGDFVRCPCADANAAIFLKSVTDDSDVLMHRSGVTTVADNSFPTAHTKLYEIGNGCHFPCRAIFRRKFNAVNGYVFTILRNKRKRVIKALFDIAKYNIFASVNKNSGKLSAYIKNIVTVALFKTKRIWIINTDFTVITVFSPFAAALKKTCQFLSNIFTCCDKASFSLWTNLST